MSGSRIFLAILTMTQVKAVEVPMDLKFRCATQARTDMLSHRILFYDLQVTRHINASLNRYISVHLQVSY
ncbi:hypothetical protein MARSALSMR5_03053 [Marinobacter salarius]|jgi:hypothetical protein|uniref:Uncharacterized protein n=1 Tax=Marinobacter salarius TaxID=1420917 RepID=A0A1W6KCE4_9GAMM|nr:hypothetical protein MARSALSMR5_03053 [Marinobacter salarius]